MVKKHRTKNNGSFPIYLIGGGPRHELSLTEKIKLLKKNKMEWLIFKVFIQGKGHIGNTKQLNEMPTNDVIKFIKDKNTVLEKLDKLIKPLEALAQPVPVPVAPARPAKQLKAVERVVSNPLLSHVNRGLSSANARNLGARRSDRHTKETTNDFEILKISADEIKNKLPEIIKYYNDYNEKYKNETVFQLKKHQSTGLHNLVVANKPFLDKFILNFDTFYKKIFDNNESLYKNYKQALELMKDDKNKMKGARIKINIETNDLKNAKKEFNTFKYEKNILKPYQILKAKTDHVTAEIKEAAQQGRRQIIRQAQQLAAKSAKQQQLAAKQQQKKKLNTEFINKYKPVKDEIIKLIGYYKHALEYTFFGILPKEDSTIGKINGIIKTLGTIGKSAEKIKNNKDIPLTKQDKIKKIKEIEEKISSIDFKLELASIDYLILIKEIEKHTNNIILDTPFAKTVGELLTIKRHLSEDSDESKLLLQKMYGNKSLFDNKRIYQEEYNKLIAVFNILKNQINNIKEKIGIRDEPIFANKASQLESYTKIKEKQTIAINELKHFETSVRTIPQYKTNIKNIKEFIKKYNQAKDEVAAEKAKAQAAAAAAKAAKLAREKEEAQAVAAQAEEQAAAAQAARKAKEQAAAVAAAVAARKAEQEAAAAKAEAQAARRKNQTPAMLFAKLLGLSKQQYMGKWQRNTAAAKAQQNQKAQRQIAQVLS